MRIDYKNNILDEASVDTLGNACAVDFYDVFNEERNRLEKELGLSSTYGVAQTEAQNRAFEELNKSCKTDEEIEVFLVEKLISIMEEKHGYTSLRQGYYEKLQKSWDDGFNLPYEGRFKAEDIAKMRVQDSILTEELLSNPDKYGIKLDDFGVKPEYKVDAEGVNLITAAISHAENEILTRSPKTVRAVYDRLKDPKIEYWTQRVAVAACGYTERLPFVCAQVMKDVDVRGGDAKEATKESLSRTINYISALCEVGTNAWLRCAAEVAKTEGRPVLTSAPLPVVEFAVRKIMTDPPKISKQQLAPTYNAINCG